MEIVNKVNFLGGIIVTIFAAILGKYWFLFVGLLVLNIVDWLTGWYYAYINKLESSRAGARGIVKKLGYWVIIFIAFYIAYAFVRLGELIGVDLSFAIGIGWFVLANYLVNEIRSIFENGVKLGWNVPKFLIRGLEVADKAIDEITHNKE